MKHTMRTLLGVLLALTMACGLLPGMLSTAHAFGYCPYCGSTNYFWDSMFDCYTCSNCWEDFETPSSTPPVHHHSWYYLDNDQKIEAVCEADVCPNGYNRTWIVLTLNAPSSLVCDGSAKAATISGSIPAGQELATPSGITYNPGGSTAPTEPGTYTASFSWGGRTVSVQFTLTTPAHTHSWSYQANGSTVTATCTGDGNCDYKTNGITLTINAPSSLVCDGSAKAASISGSVPGDLGLAGPSGITYNAGDSTAPTAAGSYIASFSWGGKTASVNFTLTAPAHTHSWGYQASGATVTASCGQGCDITTGLSITISAPSGTLTYDGNGKAATLSTGYNTTAFPGSYSISYTKNGSPVSGTPTEAGTYTASFTVGTATGSVNYTINKADPIANAPTGLTATYGQTLANVTLSNPEGNTPGTWSWADSTASVGDAGSHTFTANFTPNDTTNYNTASADVTVTVGKANPTATAPTGLTATYGQTLANVTLSNPQGNTPGTWAWADSTASVGDAGSHTFTANFTPNDTTNYNTASADVTVTVGKKAASVTADEKSKTYGEADPELTAVVSGTVGTDTINYTLSRAEGNNVGEYAISVNLGQNPNYEVTATGSKLTIGKKAATVTAEAKTKVYGSDDPVLTAVVTGTEGTDTINYTLSRAAGENVGEYDITVNAGENPDYDVTVIGSKLTVTRKAVTVTAEAKSKTYGDSDPDLTAIVDGAVGEDEIDYTLSRGMEQNVGAYDILVTLGQNPNYDVTAVNGKLTIYPRKVTVKADSKSKTEGEPDPALTASVTGAVNSAQISYSLSRAEGEEAGNYTIYVTASANANYNVNAVNGVFTVNAAPQPEPEPAPRTPAEVTVPVSGDDATANVTVTVEEGVAAITDTGIDGVLSAKEVGTVTVDVSALKTEITEVVIPSAMLSKVAEAVADEANSADGMEVKLTEGTIRFDAEAVTAIREQADGHDLHLKLDRVKEDELNKAQQEAVKDLDVLAAYDAYMVLDGHRVEQISAGKATVTLKVELREGQSESGIRIFTVDENGELTEVTVTFEDGEAKFEVEAFSKYIVTYDPAK